MRYNARAEPTIDSYADGRPAYVSRGALSDLAAGGPTAWRRCWRIGATVTTVERDDGIIVRSWSDWGSREDLQRAVAWWRRRGFRAASPGGLLLQAARRWYHAVAWSLRREIHAGFVGGWEEAQVRGIIHGPHKVLDLRKAYRWALTAEPMPERRSMRVARMWAPRLPGLHHVDIEPWPGAPWPARDGGPVLVETPLEITKYGAPKVRAWLGGVTWHDWLPATELAELLDDIGVAALHRSYWGMWAASTPTTCEFRSGAKTQLKPFGVDPIRAHLIVQRVRRRLAAVDSHYRYVDAVIVKADADIPTGPNIGDWRVVREYPDGVRIQWPGNYGPAEGPPDKQSGIRRTA